MGYDEEMRQPLGRDDWEQREVWAHFGVAIYFCQVVETGLVNYLLILRRSGEPGVATQTEIDEMFVELFGNTLGHNIKNVKRILGEQGEWVLAAQMAEVLELRNELVHHWMRKRVLQQATTSNRLTMIDELEAATAKLQDANRTLVERTQTMLAKAGLPEQFVADHHQHLTELAERGEEDLDAPDYFSTRPDG
jgi:hypothetical protein